jgi:hypothetical protein
VFLNTQSWRLHRRLCNWCRTKTPPFKFIHIDSEGFVQIADEATEYQTINLGLSPERTRVMFRRYRHCWQWCHGHNNAQRPDIPKLPSVQAKSAEPKTGLHASKRRLICDLILRQFTSASVFTVLYEFERTTERKNLFRGTYLALPWKPWKSL